VTLPRTYRLRDKRLIAMLIKKGKRKSTSFFQVQMLPSFSNEMKVGVIVSKKISAKAVERHRIRRRILEAVRKVFSEYEGAPFLVLFFGNRRVLNADFTELKQSITQIFV
jgi:ribonuclease P protein component